MSRKLAFLLCTAVVYGQNAVTPTPFKIGGVTVTGSIRSRLEAWDWFKADTGDNAYVFSSANVRTIAL